jgi:hypothetical protein
MIVLSSFLLVLLLAGVVLVWEARTGRLAPQSQVGASIRAALFFAALVIGAALLVRTAGSSPVLALALVPVTALSLYRLAMLVRPVVGRTARQAVGSVSVLLMVLALGLGASLSLLPEPLDQRIIVEKIFYGDSPGDQRSIDPAARRPSRV